MRGARVFRWDPWSTALLAPNRAAVIGDDEGTYTYATLTARADRLGRGLHRLGLPDGAVLSTNLPVSGRLFALALAALKYGYGLFPLVEGAEGNAALLARAGVRLHVGSTEDEMVPEVSEETLLRAAARPQRAAVPTEPRAGFLVVATRGRDGVPRPVVRYRPWYPYRGVRVQERYGAGPDRGPHVMAHPSPDLAPLGRALYALQAGSPVVVQRSWSPAAFLGLVERHRADSAFLGPDRVADLAGVPRRPAHRPRVVFHGGASCEPDVKRALIDRFGPVLHEFYEVPEGTVTEITTPEWLRRPGSVGRPLPGVRVRVAAAGGRQAGMGHVGEVLVRPWRGEGEPGDVELRTGDLGYLDARGYLYLAGRVDEHATAGHRVAHDGAA